MRQIRDELVRADDFVISLGYLRLLEHYYLVFINI